MYNFSRISADLVTQKISHFLSKKSAYFYGEGFLLVGGGGCSTHHSLFDRANGALENF